MTQSYLSQEDVSRIFGVLQSALGKKGFTEALRIIAKAGITGIGVIEQRWAQLWPKLDAIFHQMSPEGQLSALHVMADELADDDDVRTTLGKHGFDYVSGTFVPTEFLDRREAQYLPPSSASELAKATARLVEGDETGAITAACGAVDTLMQDIFVRHGFGDPAQVAFAAKVGTALKRLAIMPSFEAQLVAIGMNVGDANKVTEEMGKAINDSAQLLQTLRRTMGDVHGSKPALRQTAFDTLKWASAICAVFDGQ